MFKPHVRLKSAKRCLLLVIPLFVLLCLYSSALSKHKTDSKNQHKSPIVKQQNVQPRRNETFSSNKIEISTGNIKESTKLKQTPKHSCKFWAVIRTLSVPSEAVRRFLYLDKWCVVIVGDKKSPQNYEIPTSFLRDFVFIDANEQLKMQSPFTQSLPWNSFSRKNIGYLYALSQGATTIWDFDDNSLLKFWIVGAPVNTNLWMESFISGITGTKMLKTSKVIANKTARFFNPHPHLGSPILYSYPRGFPSKQTNHSWDKHLSFRNEMLDVTKVAVLQSLADHEPDVDSMSTGTMNRRFYFRKDIGNADQSIILPHNVYSPMNAQATLHFQKSFFALYLPHTVNEATSDIFRSYIAQTLFSLCDLYVGFFPRPLVDRDRHSYSDTASNIQDKIPLSTQIMTLVEFLDDWRRTKMELKKYSIHSMAGLMKELYESLHGRGFVGKSDVFSVKLWLEAIVGNTDNWVTQTKYSNVGRPVLYQPQGVPEDCSHADAQKQLNFWSSDLHDGTRISIPSLLAFLGHKTYLAGIKGNKTPYPEVFRNPLINIYTNLSPDIRRYETHNTPLYDSNIDRNMAYYKTNPIIKTIDGFFCSFPASMCELWMPFNKTKSIIFLTAHRYNLGRCSVTSWRNLDKKLKMLDEQNKQQPSGGPYHVIAAESRYDVEYMKYYTGLDNVQLLPAAVDFYTGGHPYKVTQPEVLVAWRASESKPGFLNEIKSFKPIRIKTKYKRYTLNDLTNHKAIIYYPYSVMSYKFSEYYSLNIPLFVPSAKYFRLHGGIGSDRTSTSQPYCSKQANLSKIIEKDPSSAHTFNPNTEFEDDPEHEMYWLQFSDFYDWPHVQYFDNRTDLEWKIANSDFMTIHKNMKKENEIRKYDFLKNWCNIIKKMNHKRLLS